MFFIAIVKQKYKVRINFGFILNGEFSNGPFLQQEINQIDIGFQTWFEQE